MIDFKKLGGPEVAAHSGAIYSLPELLAKREIKSAFIFADKNTHKAAGEKVVKILEDSGIKTKKYVFDTKKTEPNESFVGLAAMNFDSNVDAVIGVGSGVIGDISKIIANISGKKYIVVATAPSMDGYASATSSMSVSGLKISLPSKYADIIIGDTEILRNAPMKMMLAGLGDMLAKYIAICEWRISNIINGEDFSDEVADMVRSSLKKCVENAEGLLARDANAVNSVFEGLVLCGLAMKLAGTSRPASGIEHYLSHVWDMRGEEFGTPTELHGLQCAVGTFIAASLYEKINTIVPDKKTALEYVEAFDYSAWREELKKFLGKGADTMIALEEKEGKYDKAKHKARLEVIVVKWDEILSVINEEIPALDTLAALYKKVGLPMSPVEIGLDSSILPMTFMAAKDIRDKYVLPRLCFDLGIIDKIEF